MNKSYILSIVLVILCIAIPIEYRLHPERYIFSENEGVTVTVLKGFIPYWSGKVIVNESGAVKTWNEDQVARVRPLSQPSHIFIIINNILKYILYGSMILFGWLGYRAYKKLPDDHVVNKLLNSLGGEDEK